jgi:hypothetical protein
MAGKEMCHPCTGRIMKEMEAVASMEARISQLQREHDSKFAAMLNIECQYKVLKKRQNEVLSSHRPQSTEGYNQYKKDVGKEYSQYKKAVELLEKDIQVEQAALKKLQDNSPFFRRVAESKRVAELFLAQLFKANPPLARILKDKGTMRPYADERVGTTKIQIEQVRSLPSSAGGLSRSLEVHHTGLQMAAYKGQPCTVQEVQLYPPAVKAGVSKKGGGFFGAAVHEATSVDAQTTAVDRKLIKLERELRVHRYLTTHGDVSPYIPTISAVSFFPCLINTGDDSTFFPERAVIRLSPCATKVCSAPI